MSVLQEQHINTQIFDGERILKAAKAHVVTMEGQITQMSYEVKNLQSTIDRYEKHLAYLIQYRNEQKPVT